MKINFTILEVPSISVCKVFGGHELSTPLVNTKGCMVRVDSVLCKIVKLSYKVAASVCISMNN